VYTARSGIQNYGMKPFVLASIVFMAALLASPLSAAPLFAQRPLIVGQVVVKTSGIPVSYAVVGAKPGPTERFTSSDGHFALRGLALGKITVSARHIGYASLDTTVDVAAGDSLNLELELSAIAVQLPAVHSLAQRCVHPGDSNANVGPELSVLFDQVKQNADRNRLLASAYPFEVIIERKISKPEPALEARFVAYDTIVRPSDRRWRYEPGNMLGTREIESGAFGGKWFTVTMPALADFGDQRFLENHCFDFGGADVFEGDSVLRLDFVPAPSVRTLDVGGSIFLDPKTFQVRVMQLALVNLTKQLKRQISGQSIVARFKEPFAGVPVVDRIQSMVLPRDDAKGLASEPSTEDQRALRVRFLKGRP
jgi:hypothetical protein